VVDPVTVLGRLGGVARWGQLRRRVPRRRLARALADGRIVRTGHGRYALPLADAARIAASGLTGTVSHTSAALHWGWAVKVVPAQPHVTLPRKRHIAADRRADSHVHWRDLRPEEVRDGWVTSPVRTVIDCCLDLPFDEALAVFDSSWRAGLKPREVQVAAMRLPKRQRDRVWAVARAADPRAANPFESVLRAIALSVKGLRLEPQFAVRDAGFYARVDLADERLRIVVEAESVEFHTGRKAFDRDCRRYNGLVVRGWLVLRFSWEQVMFEPELVAATLRELVERRRRRRTRSTGTTARSGASTA
jgi:very-short-patch-repair endonuclease